MLAMIQPGQEVYATVSRTACRIDEFLGSGIQGEVHAANLDGQPVALKWYFPKFATDSQREILEILIERGRPNDKFLWPEELAFADDIEGFGYIMPLREPHVKSIMDLVMRRAEPSFRALATAGYHIVDSYWQLHSEGFCYRDISFGNVFLDPDTGDIRICDNDNVTIDGQARATVSGTPKFMAPEIVRNEASPSTKTDQFSEAVLLFYMLMLNHPLEGLKEDTIHSLDVPAMNRLYGSEPLFIFDPEDDSNAPTGPRHAHTLVFWNLYPGFLRDRFTQAFTVGLWDPYERVQETIWRDDMIRLRDSIVYCPYCKSENFYDEEKDLGEERYSPGCWNCGNTFSLPTMIELGGNQIMLNYDTLLFPHHTYASLDSMWDFSQPVAAVSQHPTNPSLWGLRNLTDHVWNCESPKGKIKVVEPQKSISLIPGTLIRFGPDGFQGLIS